MANSLEQRRLFIAFMQRLVILQREFTGYAEDHLALRPIILAEWDGKPHDLSSLAVNACMPRTTLYRRVHRLIEAGVITKQQDGRRVVLRVSPLGYDKVCSLLDQALAETLGVAREIAGRDQVETSQCGERRVSKINHFVAK